MYLDKKTVATILIVFLLILQTERVELGPQNEVDFVDAINQSKRLVVGITTKLSDGKSNNPLINDPYFNQFFNIDLKDITHHYLPAGSGVIVDSEKGWVITNYHIVKGASDIRVSDISGHSQAAELIGVDEKYDLALLRFISKDHKSFSIADTTKLAIGQSVLAIGNPLGNELQLSSGYLSHLISNNTSLDIHNPYFQTDIGINPGLSGGALINRKGELIGINTALFYDAQSPHSIGFSLPIHTVLARISIMINNAQSNQGYIGLDIQELTPELANAFGLSDDTHFALIVDVEKGSPAASAGFQSGDLIETVNGQLTPDYNALIDELGAYKAGDSITLEVLRGREKRSITVVMELKKAGVEEFSLPFPQLNGIKLRNADGNNGILVEQVSSSSRAAHSGLRRRDTITEINRKKVSNMDSFEDYDLPLEGEVLLKVRRDNSVFYILIE